MAKRIRRNKYNIEWVYAKECWNALKNGEPVPPVPDYSIWERDESYTREKLIGKEKIEPMKVTCNGITVHGENE